jgi:hypothetical protein
LVAAVALIGFVLGLLQIAPAELVLLQHQQTRLVTGQVVLPWCPRDRCLSAHNGFSINSRDKPRFLYPFDCDGYFAAEFDSGNATSDVYETVKMRCGGCFFDWSVGPFSLDGASWGAPFDRPDSLRDDQAVSMVVVIATLVVVAWVWTAGILCEPSEDCRTNVHGDRCSPTCDTLCGPLSRSAKTCRKLCPPNSPTPHPHQLSPPPPRSRSRPITTPHPPHLTAI